MLDANNNMAVASEKAVSSENLSSVLADSLVQDPTYWRNQEEIVISGCAGKFPESNNIAEFEHNLYNGIDMITADARRWPVGGSNAQFSTNQRITL